MPVTVVRRASDAYVANTVKDFHNQLKASLLLKDDLPNMVSAAPAALYMMGELYELAFSDVANATRLTVTPGDNDLLKSNNLPSCLMAIVRQGLKAFDDAHKNMKTLHILTPQLIGPTGTMFSIVKLLENPKEARKHLSREMKLLRDDLGKCVQAVNNIEAQFSRWDQMACELQDKAAEETYSNSAQRDTAGNDILQTKLRIGIVEQRKEFSADQLVELKAGVAEATAQYNLAMSHAGTWKDLGFAVVSEVANTTVSAINAAVDIAKESPGVISDAMRAIENTSPLAIGGGSGPQSHNSLPASQARMSEVAAKAPETSHPQQTIDPGLHRVSEIQSHISTLKGCLRHLDTDQLLKAVRDGSGPFHEALESIQKFGEEINLNSSQPKTEAQSIIKVCLDLGKEIQEKAKSSAHPGYRAPQGDSLLVDRWAFRLETQAEKALTLKARTSAQPGAAFGADVPILAPLKRTFESDRSRPLDTSALLERRWQQLEIMKASMEAERTRYDSRTERLVEEEESFRTLSTQLQMLRTSKQTMEHVGYILNQAIEYVGKLRSEIIQLANYFNTIAQIVTDIGSAQTERYLQLLEDKIKTDEKESLLLPSSKTIMGISLSDWEAQEIFASLLTLRGHFAVVWENAAFYDRVSSQYLLPTVRAVSSLSITASKEDQIEELKKLKESTDDAAKAIREEGGKRLERARQYIDGNIEAIAKETGSLPMIKSAFERKQKLIEEGVKNARIEDEPSASWNEDASHEEDPNSLGEY